MFISRKYLHIQWSCLMFFSATTLKHNCWHQSLIRAFGNVPNKVGFQPFRYFWLFAVPLVIAPFASHKSNQNPLSIIPIWVLIGNKGRALFNEVLNLWFFVTSPTCSSTDECKRWIYLIGQQGRILSRSWKWTWTWFSQEYTFYSQPGLTDFPNARTSAHL